MLLLIFLAGVIVLAFAFPGKARNVAGEARRRAAPVTSRVLPLPGKVTAILTKYFPYFQRLPQARRKKFARRVVQFMYSKRFIPRGVAEVTIEARVLISASAIQLTFGLPGVYLDHFTRILVYPNDYYSSITKKYHKGEVNPRFGIIVLSWQSFIDGYIYPTDSFNVGLHEMAHALRLENIIREEGYRFFDEVAMAKLDAFSHQYCYTPADGNEPFLRAYACTNPHEFFSVAVENFFERPAAFRANLPELYAILVTLLNQDPLQFQET